MRAKALLKSIRSLRKEIELLQEEERLMLLPKGIAYDGIKVQTSPKDRMLKTVEMIQELEDTIAEKKQELSMNYLQAFTLIYSLDNSDYRRLLILYYIDGDRSKEWNEVADIMGYSESRVKHFHGWALMEIEKRMDKSAHDSTHIDDKL